MKKLAIVGAQELTRDNAPWDDEAFDIWTISNWSKAEWCKRCDGVIEIHEPKVYKNHPADGDYWNWLQTQDSAKVFMLYPDERVKNCQLYPLHGALQLTRNLKVLGEEAQNIASSIDYAVALAIIEGYEQIDVYGVEMARSSEYKNQQASFAFWVGLCAGKGIALNINCTRGLFVKPLYGTINTAEADVGKYIKGISFQMEEANKTLSMLEGARQMLEQFKSEEIEKE